MTDQPFTHLLTHLVNTASFFLLSCVTTSYGLQKKRKEKKRKDYAYKVTPVCVNLGRSLHPVQAPGKPPPSNEEEGH